MVFVLLGLLAAGWLIVLLLPFQMRRAEGLPWLPSWRLVLWPMRWARAVSPYACGGKHPSRSSDHGRLGDHRA